MSVFESYDDEDCWLTPSKTVGTQSEKFDINVYLSDVKLGENAGQLSRKIARAQQKRALKYKKLEPLREAREKSASPIRLAASLNDSMGATSSVLPSEKTVQFECQHTALEPFFGPVEARKLSSDRPQVSPDRPVLEDEGDDFEDAADEFSDEAMERISMSASFSTIETLLGGGQEHAEEVGQSLIRAPMSQSLVKVEEEDVPRNEVSFDTIPRNFRSSSVSPRPLLSSSTEVSPRPQIVNNELMNQPRLSARNGMERRSLGSALQRTARSQSRTPGKVGFSLIAPPSGRQSRPTRSAKPTPPKPAPNQTTPVARSQPQRESPLPVYNLHADLADLDELTRRQEELLRQEVLMQQQVERKSSWQGESNSMSSSSSLASSKSIDIASIKVMPPSQTPSRLRAPSKLPRPSAHFTTPRVSAVPGRRSAVEKSGVSTDDECF